MEDDSGVIEYQVNDIIDMERKIANVRDLENIEIRISADKSGEYEESLVHKQSDELRRDETTFPSS